jgi:hypothetical protein
MNCMLSVVIIWSFWNMTSFNTTLGVNEVLWANGIIKKKIACSFCQNKLFHWMNIGTIFLQLVIINAYNCPNTWFFCFHHFWINMNIESVLIPCKFNHYYKMWVQFISPRSLNQWIHYFFTSPHPLQLVNSFKI